LTEAELRQKLADNVDGFVTETGFERIVSILDRQAGMGDPRSLLEGTVRPETG
jgi:hypothetical protein